MWSRLRQGLYVVGWIALALHAWKWLGYPGSLANSKADALLLKVVEEERYERLGPNLRGRVESAVYRIVLARPIEPDELPALAEKIVRSKRIAYWFSLRFVLADWPRYGLHPDSEDAFYAWALYREGKVDNMRIAGVSPKAAERLVAEIPLWPGERIEKVWVDHYHLLGVKFLSTIGADRFISLAAGKETSSRLLVRRLMLDEAGNEVLEAVESRDLSGASFAADGRGVDTAYFRLGKDGDLQEYDRRPDSRVRPWLRGKPMFLPTNDRH